MKAIFNNQVIANSDDTVVVEGNHYFPPESIEKKYYKDSEKHTTCFWKGEASYYDVSVDGKTATAAAWYYPKTISDRAKPIENYVAFWGDIKVEES